MKRQKNNLKFLKDTFLLPVASFAFLFSYESLVFFARCCVFAFSLQYAFI